MKRCSFLVLPWLGLVPLLLAACVALPPQAEPEPTASTAMLAAQQRLAPLRHFSAEGRFALRHESGSAAGRFNWQRSEDNDTILLSDPLGRGIAEIVGHGDETLLTTADQRQYRAADADTLVSQALGYPLPVAGLAHWLTGQAAKPAQARYSDFDPQGRPQRLIEDGWLIDYRYADGSPLPRQLTAHWGELIELRLIIEDWQP